MERGGGGTEDVDNVRNNNKKERDRKCRAELGMEQTWANRASPSDIIKH